MRRALYTCTYTSWPGEEDLVDLVINSSSLGLAGNDGMVCSRHEIRIMSYDRPGKSRFRRVHLRPCLLCPPDPDCTHHMANRAPKSSPRVRPASSYSPSTPAPRSRSRFTGLPVLATLPLVFVFLVLITSLLSSSDPSEGERGGSIFDQLILDGEPRSALILTAHPDDEVMFFSPSILGLERDGWDVRGLCLSSGTSWCSFGKFNAF
jgi:hypothetical protein